MEMTPLAGAGQPMGAGADAILNECRDIDRGIKDIYRNLEQLRLLQQRSLDDPDASPVNHIRLFGGPIYAAPFHVGLLQQIGRRYSLCGLAGSESLRRTSLHRPGRSTRPTTSTNPCRKVTS